MSALILCDILILKLIYTRSTTLTYSTYSRDLPQKKSKAVQLTLTILMGNDHSWTIENAEHAR